MKERLIMNEQNIDLTELFKVIQGLQLQVTENNLLIQELNLKIEQLTETKTKAIRTPRQPKVICSLLPKTHYLIPFDLITAEILDHVSNIVNNPRNCDMSDQYEINRDFITSLLQQGIPVYHFGNGRLAVHRFGGVRFNLSDLGINETELNLFDQLKDLEKTWKKEYKEQQRLEEVRSRIIWVSDEVKQEVLSRKFVDEKNDE